MEEENEKIETMKDAVKRLGWTKVLWKVKIEKRLIYNGDILNMMKTIEKLNTRKKLFNHEGNSLGRYRLSVTIILWSICEYIFLNFNNNYNNNNKEITNTRNVISVDLKNNN